MTCSNCQRIRNLCQVNRSQIVTLNVVPAVQIRELIETKKKTFRSLRSTVLSNKLVCNTLGSKVLAALKVSRNNLPELSSTER